MLHLVRLRAEPDAQSSGRNHCDGHRRSAMYAGHDPSTSTGRTGRPPPALAGSPPGPGPDQVGFLGAEDLSVAGGLLKLGGLPRRAAFTDPGEMPPARPGEHRVVAAAVPDLRQVAARPGLRRGATTPAPRHTPAGPARRLPSRPRTGTSASAPNARPPAGGSAAARDGISSTSQISTQSSPSARSLIHAQARFRWWCSLTHGACGSGSQSSSRTTRFRSVAHAARAASPRYAASSSFFGTPRWVHRASTATCVTGSVKLSRGPGELLHPHLQHAELVAEHERVENHRPAFPSAMNAPVSALHDQS